MLMSPGTNMKLSGIPQIRYDRALLATETRLEAVTLPSSYAFLKLAEGAWGFNYRKSRKVNTLKNINHVWFKMEEIGCDTNITRRLDTFTRLSFTKVVNIRHLGVHRRSLDLPSILQSLYAAEKFAELHQDHQTLTSISHITGHLQANYDNLVMQQDDLRNNLQLKLDDIRLQQATLEEQARVKVDELNRKYLIKAGDKVKDLLCGGPSNESCQSPQADSPFHASSDIDEILMEAVALTAVP